MSNIFEYSNPIITALRKGDSSDPYVSKSESHIIGDDGKVVLVELPSKFDKVQVTGNSVIWIEKQSGTPSENEYVVDYINKIVTFNVSRIGLQLQFDYMGRGNTYVPTTMIYTKSSEGEVTETLASILSAADNFSHKGVYDSTIAYKNRNIVDYLGSSYMAISDMDAGINPSDNTKWRKITGFSFKGVYSSTTTYTFGDYVQDINKERLYMCVVEESTGVDVTDINNWEIIMSAKEIADTLRTLESDISAAESSRVTAENTRESNETTRQSNESTRGTNETTRQNNESTRESNEATRQSQESTRQTNTATAIDNAETATANAQNLVDTSVHTGDWISTTAYVTNNHVRHNGSTWRALRDNTGVTPVEGLDWTLVAEAGTGDMSKNTYDTDGDGVVDKAEDADKLGGQIPSYYSKQSDLDDINVESTGIGVISGLLVKQQATPDMSVLVEIGTVHMPDGKRFEVSSNVTQAINTSDATYDRIDIVYMDVNGSIGYLAGTPSSTPTAPSLPSGGFLLAEVYVGVGVTSILDANITDKRTFKNTTDSLSDKFGVLSQLSTVDKTNLVSAISEVKDEGMAKVFYQTSALPSTPSNGWIRQLTADYTTPGGQSFKAGDIVVYISSVGEWRFLVDVLNELQTISIPHGLSIIETDQKSPLMLEMYGNSDINHMGKQGGFYSQFNRWNANLAIDTATYFSGTSSGKIDNSAGAAAKKSLNSQKMYLSGKKVILGIHAKSASGTPSIAVRLYGYDGADALITTKTLTATITNVFGIYYAKFDLSANTDVYWKAELEVTSFGTAADVVNFDDLITYSLSTTDFDKLDILTSDEVAEKYGYVDSVKHIQNPVFVSYGKNHNPSFNEADSLHANATVVEPYKLEFTHSSITSGATFKIKTVTNQSFTFSCTHDGAIEVRSESGSLITSTTGSSVTFTATTEITEIRFVNQTVNVKATFTNPQLELGSVATTFEAQNNTYLYGVDFQIGSDVEGTVKDRLYYHEGWKVLKRWEKDVVLDGSLGWEYSSNYTGYKRVKASLGINLSNFSNHNLIKFDGKIIKRISTTTNSSSDESFIYDMSGKGGIWITISDTDSGWLEAWTGTTLTEAWIDANFNGWRYTGDGTTHTWVSKYDGANSPTQTLAYVSANRASGMTDDNAYKLSYQLADAVVEPVTMEGDLTLIEGLNQVELTEGVIVREPIKEFVLGNGYYRFNDVDYSNTLLDYRTLKILDIYKGTDKDTSNWITESTKAYGNERGKIEEGKLDDTKSYYVTYLVLDKHLFTANAIEAEGTYNTNLKTVVDKHTDQIADLNTKQSQQDIWNTDVAIKGEGEKAQSGQNTVSVSSSTFGSLTVSFKRAFSQPPKVVATSNGNIAYNIGVYSITTTSVTLYARHLDAVSQTSSVLIDWIAIGK
jgi:hypothetical protein